MLRFRFTTVTGPLHVYYTSRSCPIKKISLILLSVFYHHVSVLFSSSLLLFYFLVWYRHIESARFVIVYHSCVHIRKTRRSMSRLTNPITPTDFFITEIRLSYFHNFFIIFWVNIKIVWDSQHILFPTNNPHVYIYTYVCIIMYMYLSCLICIYMYIHVYMFIPMLYLFVHMCTDIYMYVHICMHWHIYSFFVCTYKSIQRVIFWMTIKSISCDTNEISSRVNSFY